MLNDKKLLIFYALKESSNWILNKNSKSSKRILFLYKMVAKQIVLQSTYLEATTVHAFIIRSCFKAWIEAYVTIDAEIVPTLSTSERIRFKLAKRESWISCSCWIHVCQCQCHLHLGALHSFTHASNAHLNVGYSESTQQ